MKPERVDKMNVQKLREATPREGLSAERANSLLADVGYNRLTTGTKKNALVLFFSQFKDLLILILVLFSFKFPEIP